MVTIIKKRENNVTKMVFTSFCSTQVEVVKFAENSHISGRVVRTRIESSTIII